MNIPSIKTIESRLQVSREIAKQVRTLLGNYQARYGELAPHYNPEPLRTFEKISKLLGGFGYGYIRQGRNAKSPEIHFVNFGETYAATVLMVNGKFSIGSWGDIVERGNYE